MKIADTLPSWKHSLWLGVEGRAIYGCVFGHRRRLAATVLLRGRVGSSFKSHTLTVLSFCRFFLNKWFIVFHSLLYALRTISFKCSFFCPPNPIIIFTSFMESGSLGFLQVLTEVEILMLIFSFFTHLSNLVDLWIMQLMLWQELKTQ